MKKKILFISICLILIITLMIGCGKQTTPVSPKDDNSEKQSEQVEKNYIMRIAANMPQGSYEVNIQEEFKKRLEEKVSSSIKVELFPSGQLGAPPAIIEGIQSGTIQAYLAPIAFLSGVVPGTQIIDLPGFFKTTDQANNILNNSATMQILNEDMKNRGFLPLGYLVIDYRGVISNFPIENMSSLKGKRIRSMTSPPEQLEWEAFGASGVPVDPGEIYTALQQGMVDGISGGGSLFCYSMKLYEIAKYYNITKHAPLFSPYIVSSSWMESLPVDLQEAVISTVKEVLPWGYEHIKEIEEAVIEEMVKDGLNIVEASPEFIAELWEASKVVHDRILKDNPDWKEFYDDVKSEIDKS